MKEISFKILEEEKQRIVINVNHCDKQKQLLAEKKKEAERFGFCISSFLLQRGAKKNQCIEINFKILKN